VRGSVAAVEPALHADIEPLAWLLGTWSGTGHGIYPTIEPFDYGEELVFDHVGDAYLTYAQRSWSLQDGSAIHLERGFVRMGEGREVEWTVAHPLGLVEVAHGPVIGTAFEVATAPGLIGRTRTGMDVVATIRRYTLRDDVLTYLFEMATEGTPMTEHLHGELRRI
jgi:hypothetical protein